jgi:pimeloyl-ACP methyl ester carboxylesterase
MKHEVHLEHGTIRYEEDGTGEPLLFVHGALVSGTLWRKVVPRLAKDFRCIVPDWPLGAHETPLPPSADVSPPALARMIVDFMDALGLESATLVGNDTGGALCQLVAAEHPDRVARLVLTSCDMYDRFPPPIFKPLRTLVAVPGAVWLIAQTLRPRPAQRLPLAFGWVTKRQPDQAVVDAWLRPVRTNGGIRRDVARLFRGLEPRYTMAAAEALKRFDKPVLLAWATEDRLFPVEYARRMAGELPDATLEEIADSYTFLSEDQPDRLAEVIAAFVRRPSAVSV